MSRTLVSVCMITYKHESFIKHAIEGVLMQECDFDVELIIADDNSPDNIRTIVEGFKSNPKYSWIQYTRHDFNKGMLGNFYWVLTEAKGKYIALCEGDDYWTDPYKLQKQVDYLEENPDITLSYHTIEIESSPSCTNHKYTPRFKRTVNGIFTFFDSLQGKNGATLSMMFRSKCLENVDLSIFRDLKMGDWPLECICTLFGDGYVHEEVMGVYRVHEGGITNTFKKIFFFDSRINFSKRLLNLNINAEKKIFINEFIFKILILKSIYLMENRQIPQAFISFMNSIFYLRLKRVNKLFNWDEKYSLKNASVRLLKKIKLKLFIA